MFKSYESKPITRMAIEITSDYPVLEIAPNTYTYEDSEEGLITFKGYIQPVNGDYIVRLTAEDTYHVARAIFHERNIIPE